MAPLTRLNPRAGFFPPAPAAILPCPTPSPARAARTSSSSKHSGRSTAPRVLERRPVPRRKNGNPRRPSRHAHGPLPRHHPWKSIGPQRLPRSHRTRANRYRPNRLRSPKQPLPQRRRAEKRGRSTPSPTHRVTIKNRSMIATKSTPVRCVSAAEHPSNANASRAARSSRNSRSLPYWPSSPCAWSAPQSITLTKSPNTTRPSAARGRPGEQSRSLAPRVTSFETRQADYFACPIHDRRVPLSRLCVKAVTMAPGDRGT